MSSGKIEKRGENSWRISIYVGRDPDTGRRRDVRRTIRGTRKDAERELLRLRLETGNSSSSMPTRSLTLAAVIREYLVLLEGLGRSPSTLAEYERVLDQGIAQGPGRIPLHRLTVADLDRFYAGLRAKGLSPRSVRRRHALIRGAIGQAEKWGWVDRNVATLATLPPADDVEIAPPTADIVTALWQAVEDDDPDWAALIRLVAVAGLRRGEVCALRWSDLDLDAGEMTIRRAMVHDRRSGSTLVERDTPKHRSRRAVPLVQATVADLRGVRVRQRERALAFGVRLVNDCFVWSSSLDGADPYRPDSVTQRFTRLRDRVPGAEKVRLHDLRHFVATRLRASGVDLTTIAGYVGHRDESTTARVYAHPMDDAMRDAAARMGRLVGRPDAGTA